MIVFLIEVKRTYPYTTNSHWPRDTPYQSTNLEGKCITPTPVSIWSNFVTNPQMTRSECVVLRTRPRNTPASWQQVDDRGERLIIVRPLGRILIKGLSLHAHETIILSSYHLEIRYDTVELRGCRYSGCFVNELKSIKAE